MIFVTSCETGEYASELYARFTSSREYLDGISARLNEESKRQSFAGLRALLFLLEIRGIDPSPLVLERRKGGKPYFKNSNLKFGISHSGGLAVCGLSEREVGIDVELIKERKNIEEFAKRFFSEAERDILLSGDATEEFFTVWTGKEAALKLDGRGVDLDLRKIDTAALPLAVYRSGDYVMSVAGGDETDIIGDRIWTRKR